MRALLLAAFAFVPACVAQPPPRCGPGLDGQVSGNGCYCRYRTASQLSQQPAGWRWSCGLLDQGAPAPLPAELPARQGDLPNGFVYAPSAAASATQPAATAPQRR